MGNNNSQQTESSDDFVEINETTDRSNREILIEGPLMIAKREGPSVALDDQIIPEEQIETYQEKIDRMYRYYFDMFNGGLKVPTGNKSYDEYIQWRYWKGEYEKLYGF